MIHFTTPTIIKFVGEDVARRVPLMLRHAVRDDFTVNADMAKTIIKHECPDVSPYLVEQWLREAVFAVRTAAKA